MSGRCTRRLGMWSGRRALPGGGETGCMGFGARGSLGRRTGIGSRRRVEIEERARELTGVAPGSLSRERLQGIALATRKAKVYGVDGARWQQEARARAAEHGLGSRELERLSLSSPRAAGVAEADV